MKRTFGDILLIVILAIGLPVVALSAMYHLHDFYVYNFTTIPCGENGELQCRPARR